VAQGVGPEFKHQDQKKKKFAQGHGVELEQESNSSLFYVPVSIVELYTLRHS
jgi:hypothetical protein